jgi:hypothetical protein
LTGTVRTPARRSTANPTSTGAWSRPAPRAALPRSAIVTSIVGSPSSSPAGCSATLPTSATRPRAVRPVGSSTVTASPVRASACRVASRSTVTCRRVDETAASVRPGAACSPTAAWASPIRVAPGRKTTSPRVSVASSTSPRSSWKRSTAAVVAQSQVSSTVMSPSGSWPSATRLRSSWRTSAPSLIPGAKSRHAGRRP